jgi:hypothetical protein
MSRPDESHTKARDSDELILSEHRNIYGARIRMTRRTDAHLTWTISLLPKGCTLRIIQGCYNTTVAISKGTHDFDAVFDVEIVGMSWFSAQHWLRAHGWAAWVRVPPTFSYHIHMVSLGYTGRVGEYVPGQVEDYYNHLGGLVGYDPDESWFPDNIDATIFDYDAYLEELNDVQLQDDIYPDPRRKVTVGLLFRRLDSFMAASTRSQARSLRQLAAIREDLDAGATPAQIRVALDKLEEDILAGVDEAVAAAAAEPADPSQP